MQRRITLLSASVVGVLLIVSTAARAQEAPERSGRLEEVATSTVFSNTRSGYVARYPADWHSYEIPSSSYTRFENMDAAKLRSLPVAARQQYFKIEVVVLPSLGLSLPDWVEHQNTTSYPLPTVLKQEEIVVAGEPALYQVEQFGSLIHPVVFIKRGESIYLINIGANHEENRGAVQSFLAQFRFNQ